MRVYSLDFFLERVTNLHFDNKPKTVSPSTSATKTSDSRVGQNRRRPDIHLTCMFSGGGTEVFKETKGRKAAQNPTSASQSFHLITLFDEWAGMTTVWVNDTARVRTFRLPFVLGAVCHVDRKWINSLVLVAYVSCMWISRELVIRTWDFESTEPGLSRLFVEAEMFLLDY